MPAKIKSVTKNKENVDNKPISSTVKVNKLSSKQARIQHLLGCLPTPLFNKHRSHAMNATCKKWSLNKHAKVQIRDELGKIISLKTNQRLMRTLKKYGLLVSKNKTSTLKLQRPQPVSFDISGSKQPGAK